jgi:hypothetical protein
MWTPTIRQQHSRPVTRYQTDLTDTEWRVIAPHLSKPCATAYAKLGQYDDARRSISEAMSGIVTGPTPSMC